MCVCIGKTSLKKVTFKSHSVNHSFTSRLENAIRYIRRKQCVHVRFDGTSQQLVTLHRFSFRIQRHGDSEFSSRRVWVGLQNLFVFVERFGETLREERNCSEEECKNRANKRKHISEKLAQLKCRLLN